MSKLEAINFFSSNYSCTKCFNNPKITKSGQTLTLADVRGPQPRWIGSNYFNSAQKICVMLINPGSGDKTPENEWAPLKKMNLARTDKDKEIIINKNICDVNSNSSNVGNSILLNFERLDNFRTKLNWNFYNGWIDNTNRYEIQKLNSNGIWETFYSTENTENQIIINE